MFDKGSIIQYFRQKKGLTQEELGHGICSKTHLSKIERGLTEVSEETIALLCNRMGFSMDEELEKLNNVQKLIEMLQKQLIHQDKQKALDIIEELNNVDFKYIQPLNIRFLLLKARYYLVIDEVELSKEILFSRTFKNQKIPQPEEDLLNHTLGIYYIKKNEVHTSLIYLKKVSLELYRNPEVHYHLALAYHMCEGFISAYYHLQKAKEFFIFTNNYHRILDTESLLLMITEDEGHLEFNEVQMRYDNLLDIADKIKDEGRQVYLLHNFAYQLYRHEMYQDAAKYYQMAMEVNKTNKFNYLNSYFGYIRCIYDGKLENKSTIIPIINEGLEEATSSKQLLFIHFFKLYFYKVSNETSNYYLYLEKNLIPYLYEIKHKTFFDYFIKDLIQFYISNDYSDKLLQFLKNYSIKISMEE